MVQVSFARGWDLDVERGPDWLFVHPHCASPDVAGTASLGEHLWALLEQNFSHRLVLELSDIGQLTSQLVSQLLWLEKRIHGRDGMLRLCGLSEDNLDVVER